MKKSRQRDAGVGKWWKEWVNAGKKRKIIEGKEREHLRHGKRERERERWRRERESR